MTKVGAKRLADALDVSDATISRWHRMISPVPRAVIIVCEMVASGDLVVED